LNFDKNPGLKPEFIRKVIAATSITSNIETLTIFIAVFLQNYQRNLMSG